MTKTAERISALEERLKQLKAQQHKKDARERAKIARQTRQAETRRKFLVGAVVLAHVEHDAIAKTKVRQWLDDSLESDEDRALFDLPPSTRRPTSDGPPSSDDKSAANAASGKLSVSADGERQSAVVT
jgi:hypothetical protein